MQGNSSDLMHGLSLQSVNLDDRIKYHEPLSLSVIIYAAQALVDKVLARSPKVQELIENEWIHLSVV